MVEVVGRVSFGWRDKKAKGISKLNFENKNGGGGGIRTRVRHMMMPEQLRV